MIIGTYMVSANKKWFFILLGVAISTFSHAAIRSARILGPNDVVPELQCKSDRLSCVCKIGLVGHTFVSHNGQRYFQCAPANCPNGTILKQSRTPGGKTNFACVVARSAPYTEPPKPELKRPVDKRNGRGGR